MAFQHLFCTNSTSAFDLISFRALQKYGFKVCFMFLSAHVNNSRSAKRGIYIQTTLYVLHLLIFCLQ